MQLYVNFITGLNVSLGIVAGSIAIYVLINVSSYRPARYLAIFMATMSVNVLRHFIGDAAPN